MIPFLSVLLFAQAAVADTAVPDFTLRTFHQDHRWRVLLKPPAKHHFNIQAPMSAKVGAHELTASVKTEPKVIFEGPDSMLAEKDEVSVNVFLCDDAKTYCVKKSGKAVLSTMAVFENAASDSTAVKELPKTSHQVVDKEPPASLKSAVNGKKDHHGFWDNNLQAAVAEARKTKKPLFIDFYGIWCPPCNLFNELVFPTAKFKTAAKKYVLLKIDVDAKASWKIRDYFKIGGYPTIIFIKTPDAEVTDDQLETSLKEIDRDIGFFPLDDFIKDMNDAWANRNQTLDERVAADQKRYIESLKKLIQTKKAQLDQEGAAKVATQALALSPLTDSDIAYFQLTQLQAQVNAHSEVLKDAKASAVLKTVWQNRKATDVDNLLIAEDIAISNGEQATPDQLKWAGDDLDEVATHLNPKTLNVDNHEMSIADIDSARADLAEAQKVDEKAIKAAREQAQKSYLKMIDHFHGEDSRGLHLELAYFYWSNGQFDEAKKIYERFIAKYPQEFTFYFAEAKMALVQKDLKLARVRAESALQYSYGDNRLRSIERLVQVMKAQGESDQARARADQVLAEYDPAKIAHTRTERYYNAVKKSVEKASPK